MPSSEDWFGFAHPSYPTDLLPLRQVTGGTASGSKSVTLPATLTQGTYEVRLYAAKGNTLLAVSAAFRVIPPVQPVVAISPSVVGLDQTATITYYGVPSGTSVAFFEIVGEDVRPQPSFTITSDPYTLPIRFSSDPGQTINGLRAVATMVIYTYRSVIGGKNYDVQLTLKP